MENATIKAIWKQGYIEAMKHFTSIDERNYDQFAEDAWNEMPHGSGTITPTKS